MQEYKYRSYLMESFISETLSKMKAITQILRDKDKISIYVGGIMNNTYRKCKDTCLLKIDEDASICCYDCEVADCDQPCEQYLFEREYEDCKDRLPTE